MKRSRFIQTPYVGRRYLSNKIYFNTQGLRFLDTIKIK